MNDDVEVRCEALRMEYQKRIVRSNFIGIILIFCFFCIKTKDEKLFFYANTFLLNQIAIKPVYRQAGSKSMSGLNSEFIYTTLLYKLKSECHFDRTKNE